MRCELVECCDDVPSSYCKFVTASYLAAILRNQPAYTSTYVPDQVL